MSIFSELVNFLERNFTDNYLITQVEHWAIKEKAKEDKIKNLYNCTKKFMKSIDFVAEKTLEVLIVLNEDKEVLLLKLSDTG